MAFDSPDLIQAAFVAGQCDGWSSDVSQLTGLRSAYPEGPDALTILPEVFSKEPLAPAVADGDSEWAQAVDWAVIATIAAEELGITKANVDEMLTSEDLTSAACSVSRSRTPMARRPSPIPDWDCPSTSPIR